MRWTDFLQKSYPPDQARNEARKDIIFRTHRWVGLRLAYMLCTIGLTANQLTYIRILMALVGSAYLYFGCINSVLADIWTGLLLVYGQNVFDYADGPISRARGESTQYGAMLDDITNVISRTLVLAVFGMLANSNLLLLLAIASSMLINFGNKISNRYIDMPKLRFLKLFYKYLFSLYCILFLMPLLLLACVQFGWPVEMIVRYTVYAYSGLVLVWLYFGRIVKPVTERVHDAAKSVQGAQL